MVEGHCLAVVRSAFPNSFRRLDSNLQIGLGAVRTTRHRQMTKQPLGLGRDSPANPFSIQSNTCRP
jgi:hypothetical protein